METSRVFECAVVCADAEETFDRPNANQGEQRFRPGGGSEVALSFEGVEKVEELTERR